MKLLVALMAALWLLGCSSEDNPQQDANQSSLTPLVFITDWYPQPEHGGFYQAKAKGFYREAGLDVEVRSGGGVRDVRTMVATGQVDLAMGTSDTTLIGITRGLPLKILAPYFQHDPQCIMFHPGSGIERLEDLDEKVVMMAPSLSYSEYMTKILDIDLKFIPLDYSTSRFANDKNFIQQCFVTSEPVFLAEQGIPAEVIMLSESGFDPYRIFYTTEELLAEKPAAIKAFTEATIRGWRDFIEGDPTPALELIAKENPQQNRERMLNTIAAMKKYRLVRGHDDQGDQLGHFQLQRLEKQIQQLKSLGLIGEQVTLDKAFSQDLLPELYEATP